MKWKSRPSRSTAFVLILTLSIVPFTEQYGSGAPEKACETMLPRHQNLPPQTSSSPYVVQASASQVRQGTGVNVTITSPLGASFGGFFLQARSVQNPDKVIGTWSKLPASVKYGACIPEGNSVTHTNPGPKQSEVIQWDAPTDFLGSVIFRATVAEAYATFWEKIETGLVEVVPPNTVITTTPTSSTNYQPTLQTFTPPIQSTIEPPQPNNAFYEGCEKSKLCFGSDKNCIRNQNCRAVVAVTVKGDVYTFELLGSARGYVAVGLSSDQNMGDDSAMECSNINGNIRTHTSWTYPKSDPYVTRDNVPQNIIRPLKASLINGNIYCEFTREAMSTVRNFRFDLVNDRFYLLLASGNNATDTKVGFHTDVYMSSDTKLSLAEVGSVAAASKLLLRLHGAFMLAAWIGTASCGILLARYYRQTWVGNQLGGKDLWFAWHRIFMVCTWILTMAAFIIILVEVGGWAGTGDNAHAITGIVTIVLCFLQPIGAFFRPHPNTSKRPIFNWIHWFMGNVAHILGIVTIFFAVYLNKAELPGWVVYILVGFVAFHVIMHIILSVAACISDGRISNGRVNSFPMKDLMTNTRQAMNQDRRTDAPHGHFRKFLLGLYFTIIIIFVVVLICLIVLAPIEDTYKSVTEAISGDKN